MPSDCFPHHVIQSQLDFQVFKINFSSCYATNVISEIFTWLLLKRSRKTCLALQCVRVQYVVQPFFIKSKFTFEKNFIEIPRKCLSGKLLTLIIIIIIIFIVHLFTVDKKRVQTIFLKKLINPFLANVPILHPLKTPENRRFAGVFSGCKMGTLARNGLKSAKKEEKSDICIKT